jgi:hypothetical protein
LARERQRHLGAAAGTAPACTAAACTAASAPLNKELRICEASSRNGRARKGAISAAVYG